MYSLFLSIFSSTCCGCYLHPSSGAQTAAAAIGVCNGFGMLIHWSRYWLGHPHTFSMVRSHINTCTSSWTFNWTYTLPWCMEPWTSNALIHIILLFHSVAPTSYGTCMSSSGNSSVPDELQAGLGVYKHAPHRILLTTDPNRLVTQQIQKSSLRMAHRYRNM
jgi:hypothetical protein